ncbi:hypothetical protein B0J11DRAFT_525044 [Dendryphion nanum]|uniref:2EXR domain-containing protein n=1 Tax=Dendryphion nanum TaxID=256645 RepID=A0A9P9DXY3_9PLEO|nr:hypothetical protein B0J11DRAFT_525044 [Dendryphion nanum]
MPSMVCRISHRPGQPLGLCIYPAMSFLDLPREVRDMIYEYILIDTNPILVYSVPTNADNNYEIPQNYKFRPRTSHLTLGLLRVNREIAMESASLFYYHNTFQFGDRYRSASLYNPFPGGFDYWDALYSFLSCIGSRNRNRLRKIEMDISRPQLVTKDEHGTVSSYMRDSWWLKKVHSRDTYTRKNGPEYDGSRYDDISPAIEAVFRILGKKGPKLRLSLILDFQIFPEDPVSPYRVGWGGEIPRHVELMRKRFTALPDKQEERVDVLWEGGDTKRRFLDRIEVLVHDGWQIVSYSDVFGPHKLPNRPWLDPSVFFTLRRKGRSEL